MFSSELHRAGAGPVRCSPLRSPSRDPGGRGVQVRIRAELVMWILICFLRICILAVVLNVYPDPGFTELIMLSVCS